MERIRNFLSSHPWFRGLAPRQLDQVAKQASWQSVMRGELVALEGDPCQEVYLVVEGRLRLVKSSSDGREQVVAELQAGDSLHTVPALDGGPIPTSAMAATRAMMVGFTRSDFLILLQQNPRVGACLLLEYAQRLRQLTTLVEDLSLHTVPQRLARLLLQRGEAGSGERITQREMAAQLGTVREVLARNLAEFERRGWLRITRGVIEITDAQALRDVLLKESRM